LRAARADEDIKSLGYAVYCNACGYLVADSDDGLDEAGGWILDGSDSDRLTFLDGWPDNMLIFETEEKAAGAIDIIINSSKEKASVYGEDDFDVIEIFSIIKTVSTLAIRNE
jgi:hypothetical protein